jgi:ribosomal protein S18 acetylase RimI-like enzyme
MAADVPRQARTQEWPAAFARLFQGASAELCQRRVQVALTMLRQGELDPRGVLVLADGNGVTGAILCLPIAGATALVWPPQVIAGPKAREREDALIGHAARWLQDQGIKLAQALLAPEEADTGRPLLRNGFFHLTQLEYLRHSLDIAIGWLAAPAQIVLEPYSDVNPTLFGEVLERTYQGTQDCPELNGVRSTQEVLEGYRSQTRGRPPRWWLALRQSQPVGVLITSDLPESACWELSYLGLVPEARGQGWGRELVLHALLEARADGAAGLTLSVDCRNLPASNLYQSLGFEPFDSRVAFVALWRR